MKRFSFLLVATFLLTGILSMPVEAGSSDIIIDASTYAEELDNSVWNNPDSDLTISNNTIVFDNSSSDVTRLITKTAVKATAEVEELVKAQATMQFTSLPANERFVMALGVKKIESLQGEPGNVEITFANNGGLTVSVVYYNEDGDELESLSYAEAPEITVDTNKICKIFAWNKNSVLPLCKPLWIK